jgi:hypothetical protein
MIIKIKRNSNKNFKKINFNCIAVFSRDFRAKKNLRELLLEKKITFEEDDQR